MTDHALITPTEASEWRAYHDIRRQVLFESRGQFGVYQEDHPDDTTPGNHPKLLMYRGDPVGVVRIDVDGAIATVRRVAIRKDVQRRGHGRALFSLVRQFALAHGCGQLASHVAPDAVGFYERCSFTVNNIQTGGSSGQESVFMTRRV
jgi:GNAT superfamily N-acetyltransferase